MRLEEEQRLQALTEKALTIAKQAWDNIPWTGYINTETNAADRTSVGRLASVLLTHILTTEQVPGQNNKSG